MPKDIYEEKPITLAEVREILLKREMESDTELSYVQQVTLDYVNKFCRYSLEDALNLKEELMNRFNLSEKTAIQLVNLYHPPTLPTELNIILDKEPVKLTEEQKQDIIDLIRSYVEKSE
ncbi:MAG: RNA polymerase Rpb4 family protein [Candidatus Helarchaeota archaeon]